MDQLSKYINGWGDSKDAYSPWMKKLEKEKNDDVLSSKHYTFLSCRYTCSRRCFYSYSKGKVHALLGMNGAGKSTLLKIATGEIQPVVGDIKLILSLFPLLHRAMQKAWHFFRNTRSRSRTYSRIICIRKCTNRSFSNAK